MAVKDKYASVLSLGEKLGVRDGKVEEGADGGPPSVPVGGHALHPETEVTHFYGG